MSAAGAEGSTQWALLIGIDRYRYFDPLAGCVNDVMAMAQVLLEHFGFRPENVLRLTGEAATQAGIRAALRELLPRLGEGDVVVLHFSGHGSQMRDREGDEADGWDETIVPFDSGRYDEPNRDISDDEIHLWLRRLAAVTQNVTLVFDCCHSGTITRDPFGDRARSVPRDERPAGRLPPSPLPSRPTPDKESDIGPGGWLPVSQSHTLFAACRSDERAHEMTVGKSGHTQGALTYQLVRALRKARRGTTCRDIFEALAPQVTRVYPGQHPQLEGARDREVFGGRDLPAIRFVPVRERSGDRVVLGGGLVLGVTAGSRWSVYREATKRIANRAPVGAIDVAEVEGFASVARVLDEASPGAVREGMRAVETGRRPGGAVVSVQLVAGRRYRAEAERLRAEIEEAPALRLVGDRDEAEVCVYLVAPRRHVRPGDPVPRLGAVREPTWAAVGRGDDLLVPLHGAREEGVHRTMRENLERLARVRYALSLEDPEGPLQGLLRLSLLRRRSDGRRWRAAAAGETLELVEGDFLGFEVTNRSAAALDLALLDFGLTGSVRLLYPGAGVQDPLAPGRTLRIGTRRGEGKRLVIPEAFPLNPWDAREDGGIETVKLFGATHELDPEGLAQNAFRDGEGLSRLEELLAPALAGLSTRDLERSEARPVRNLWTTVQRSFVVKAGETVRAGPRRP